jgi:DNA-directed RNA polymerase specialized sigma24 family protein
MPYYCSPSQLLELTRNAQETGVISDALVAKWHLICVGIFSKYLWSLDPEDMEQEIMLKLILGLSRMDCSLGGQKIFAYCTGIVLKETLNAFRKRRTDLGIIRRYACDLAGKTYPMPPDRGPLRDPPRFPLAN